MTAALHTPGPWHVRTLENFGWNVVHYRNGDKFDIVRVAKVNEEANARLIASAPDLLEAARPFEEIIQEGTDDLPDETGVTVKIGERVLDLTLSLADFRAVRAAIAKAVTP